MDAKASRAASIEGLLARNGVTLGPTNEHIQEVDDWLKSHIESDPRDPTRLRAIWYSVVNDLSLYLGDLIVARHPIIRWTFFDGPPGDISFQRHVLMGFTQPANPRYNVDIDRLVATYGHRIVAGLDVAPNYLVSLVEYAAKVA